MKKIGLITIIDNNNYGNRLQNYATQTILKKLGYDVTTILNRQKSSSNQYKKVCICEKLKNKSISEIVLYAGTKIKGICSRKAKNRRTLAFCEFSEKYIKRTNYVISSDYIPKGLADEFDYFIVGSDQVWNPFYRKGSFIDFLTFAPKMKRIAYAASFGITNIPDEYYGKYRQMLSDFKSLSVREESGTIIIKEMLNREAVVLIDPTMMLTKNEWIEISKVSPIKSKRPFLLTYFLGPIPDNVKTIVKYLSKNENLEAVKLSSLEQLKNYDASPNEFVDYVYSAKIFLTDSFHGVAFSIILETPFIVFDRASKHPSMSSRIDTLLSKFDLEDRKWENVKELKNYFDVDFSHVPPILEKEREKAYKYLRNALNIEDNNTHEN